MNDKKIITEKELNYIETLYIYCNIDDFDTNIDNHASKSYEIMKDILIDEIIDLEKKGQYLSFAKGREWYRTKNYRIGLMSYDTARKANQYNCVIQYEQHHMYSLDKELSGLDLPFGGDDLSKYKIKRIDVTKIAKHKKNYLKNYNFISQFRRTDRVDGTVYLGNRRNGCVVRMYNKTKELLTNTKEHPINYNKIELLSKYFGDVEDLYTYELEMHRGYLKECLGIETLTDLEKVYLAYKNIVGQIRIYKDTDQNKNLIKNNNRDRIKAYKLTEFEHYERVEKKRYKTSFKYTHKITKGHYDRYIDTMGLKRTDEEYSKFINALIEDRIQDTKYIKIKKITPPLKSQN